MTTYSRATLEEIEQELIQWSTIPSVHLAILNWQLDLHLCSKPLVSQATKATYVYQYTGDISCVYFPQCQGDMYKMVTPALNF